MLSWSEETILKNTGMRELLCWKLVGFHRRKLMKSKDISKQSRWLAGLKASSTSQQWWDKTAVVFSRTRTTYKTMLSTSRICMMTMLSVRQSRVILIPTFSLIRTRSTRCNWSWMLFMIKTMSIIIIKTDLRLMRMITSMDQLLVSERSCARSTERSIKSNSKV